MTYLQNIVHQLQLNNKLVVLRSCGGSEQDKLIASLTQGCNIVDLSLAGVRMQAKQDAAAFAGNLPLPAYVANLQYMPSLLPQLMVCGAPLSKLIAGCRQSYYLHEQAAQNPERIAFVELPLSCGSDGFIFALQEDVLARLSEFVDKKDVLTAILRGDLACGDSMQKAAFISRALQQDIMEQTTVSDEMRFFNFLRAAAGMAGNVVNYTILANVVGISAPTAKQWLQFLEGAGLVYFLHPVASVAGKRLVKAPKLYFKDTGIAAYLLQLYDKNSLRSSLHFKALLENYVVNILRESCLRRGVAPEILFYRDSNNKEISALWRCGDTLHPLLISKDGISERKLAKLFALLAPYAEENGVKLGCGCMITLGGKSCKLGDNLWQVNAELL